MSQNRYKFLFAGGGTGGHLFPAVAVAQKIKELNDKSEILFIGTKTKIEGRVVPALGFKFKSIWIKGFARKLTLENILFPIKLIVSLFQSLIINFNFKPHVAIGSGGYVSGPAVWGASILGAKIMLLEQNSYPGVTTRLLEKYADEIHLSFDSSKKYMREEKKLFVSGNPVRIQENIFSKSEAKKSFGLNSELKTIAVLGGSLGAKRLNEIIARIIIPALDSSTQIIWQTGKNYFAEYKKFMGERVMVYEFIDDMNAFYSASDLLIARAGATTIAEVTAVGVPTIFIPSPNVAANHQYFNAKALMDCNAAIMVEEKNIDEKFLQTVLELLNDEEKKKLIRENAIKMGNPNAAKIIAERAILLAEKKYRGVRV